jgi:hypothetical protein
VREAVDDRRVHDLSLSGGLRMVQRGQDAHQQVHRAAAEVAQQVHRHLRRAAGPADGRQRPGQRNVVDVVPGRRRTRPRLAPAGHPRVDQTRVAAHRGLRPHAEPLGDTRPVRLDQHVGLLREAQHGLGALGVLEVDHQRTPSPVESVGDQ